MRSSFRVHRAAGTASSLRGVRGLALLLALASASVAAAEPGAAEGPEVEWLSTSPDGQPIVHLYLFRSSRCAHCQDALPLIRDLDARLAWVELHDFEILSNREHAARYQRMAADLGERAQYVPAFFFCGRMLTGWDNEGGMGQTLERGLEACREQAQQRAAPELASGGPAEEPEIAEIPGLGKLEPGQVSLPVLTVILAGLDAFNPCAFFVLLFLLSLLVHARSRWRMAVIGGVFVVTSGVAYFVFMAAWLNLWLIVGQLGWVTLAAGLVALVIAALNIKDYFAAGTGPSLSIPEGAKPGLFRRMRDLVHADRPAVLFFGAITLAAVANTYELLCTAGFPMVFTRALTMADLSPAAYYGYLALYNLIYIVPLAVIVAAFTWTMGARKLGEREGRTLKLLSGLLMLGLGSTLIVAPDALVRLPVAIGLVLGAIALTFIINRIDRARLTPGTAHGPPASGRS